MNSVGPACRHLNQLIHENLFSAGCSKVLLSANTRDQMSFRFFSVLVSSHSVAQRLKSVKLDPIRRSTESLSCCCCANVWILKNLTCPVSSPPQSLCRGLPPCPLPSFKRHTCAGISAGDLASLCVLNVTGCPTSLRYRGASCVSASRQYDSFT